MSSTAYVCRKSFLHSNIWIALVGLLIVLELLHLTRPKETSVQVISHISHISDNLTTQAVPKRALDLLYKDMFCPNMQACTLLPELKEYSARYAVAPNFGIATCIILKNFSTVFTSIICYLFDPESYRKAVPDMMKDTFFKRKCRTQNELTRFTGIHRRINNTARIYVITRDPLERFISGFVDKCILAKNQTEARYNLRKNPCYGCGGNMTCFMLEQYNAFVQISNGKKAGEPLENVHFAPQTWNCEMRQHYFNYTFLKYSPPKTAQFLEQLFAEFSILGVPANISDDIRNQVLGKTTFHSTYNSELRTRYTQELQRSALMTELLVKMYFYDYKYLSYDFPEMP